MSKPPHWCQYREWNENEFEESRWNEYGEFRPPLLVRSTRVFEMLLPYSEAWIEVVEFPRERFVVYEPSDAVWAVPLGIAKLVRKTFDCGGFTLNLKRFTGEDREVFVKNAEALQPQWKTTTVRVTGMVPPK